MDAISRSSIFFSCQASLAAMEECRITIIAAGAAIWIMSQPQHAWAPMPKKCAAIASYSFNLLHLLGASSAPVIRTTCIETSATISFRCCHWVISTISSLSLPCMCLFILLCSSAFPFLKQTQAILLNLLDWMIVIYPTTASPCFKPISFVACNQCKRCMLVCAGYAR